jgi:hypothetical protein
VTANDNFLWGAMLTTTAGDVTVANSIFNANTTEDPGFIDDTGLLITSAGNVSISNSHADENRLIGATITAVGDVAISNSTFNGNNGITGTPGNQTLHGYGLGVVTQGNITLSGVLANDNTLYGAHLDAGMDVTVTGSSFSILTSDPVLVPVAADNHGLHIVAAGNVFLDTVNLSNNATYGASIQAGGDVFLDSVTATNNGTNGVEVVANCTNVFLMNGTFTGNGQYGLSIVNGLLTQSGTPLFSGNGAGDIFQDPGTCVFPTTPPTPPTPPVPPTTPPNSPNPPTPPAQNPAAPVTSGASAQGGSSLSQTVGYSGGNSLFKSASGSVNAKSLVSLKSFLSGATHVDLFSGLYAIVYFEDGSMQIIVLAPNSVDGLAMGS